MWVSVINKLIIDEEVSVEELFPKKSENVEK